MTETFFRSFTHSTSHTFSFLFLPSLLPNGYIYGAIFRRRTVRRIPNMFLPISRYLTDILMVTTTVRMLDRIHIYTTQLRPAIVSPCVCGRLDQLQGWAYQYNHHRLQYQPKKADVITFLTPDRSLIGLKGLAGVRVLGNHRHVVAWDAGQLTTIAGIFLQTADNGAFWHQADGIYISNLKLGLQFDRCTFGINKNLLADLGPLPW